MNTASSTLFDRQYQTHLKHLKLKGLQPKTIDAYARAIRRLGEYFGQQIDDLTEAQFTAYLSDLIGTHSWTTVKLDLYGLKFYTTHVLKKTWVMPNLIKPLKTQHLPDIVTVDEAQRLFSATRTLSYRVFYFTLYSLGLRLGEGLALKVGTSMPPGCASRSATPRATGIASCPCRQQRWPRASGRSEKTTPIRPIRDATPKCEAWNLTVGVMGATQELSKLTGQKLTL